MKHFTLRVSDDVHTALQQKAIREKISISDAVRDCINRGLEIPKNENSKNDLLLRTSAVHSLLSYCLIDEFVGTLDHGHELRRKAELNADRISDEIVESII